MSTQHAPLSAWMSRLVHRKAVPQQPSSILASRVEVRPPAQWPSSMTWQGNLRRWIDLQLNRLPDSARPVNRLTVVKEEFLTHLADLDSRHATVVGERIGAARSLRELWHLRSPLYNVVATSLSQGEGRAPTGAAEPPLSHPRRAR